MKSWKIDDLNYELPQFDLQVSFDAQVSGDCYNRNFIIQCNSILDTRITKLSNDGNRFCENEVENVHARENDIVSTFSCVMSSPAHC